jgi:hypothetical protein
MKLAAWERQRYVHSPTRSRAPARERTPWKLRFPHTASVRFRSYGKRAMGVDRVSKQSFENRIPKLGAWE